MDLFLFSETKVTQLASDDHTLSFNTLHKQTENEEAGRFVWIDVTHDEVIANPEKWRDDVERLSGVKIFDLHLKDVVNLTHPSNFDATQDYELVIFQKLSFYEEEVKPSDNTNKKIPAALQKLQTVPVSFLVLGNTLVTVRAAHSRTIENLRQRLLSIKPKSESNNGFRLPTSPEDLMLRLLNLLVDQYLELRQPLTMQLDRWQRALLDPRKPFNNWIALLDSRVELKKLDHLCEDQYDAIQELRDHFIDTYDSEKQGTSRTKDLLLVRTNDVMEHINRVLNHARRLESSLESAVQIHFSAMSHRTSEIMRTLTIITALFMPLTLLTGIFGMNFLQMPLVTKASGFWIVIASMAIIVLLLLIVFRSQQYFENKANSKIE